MHRRLSIIGVALVALGAPDRSPAASGAEVTTTVYVGRYYEVRGHDQPVKYVFDQEMRLARITGSLSNNTRVQRLRLRTGWNLISLAVTAADFLGQAQEFNAGQATEPLLRAAYRWHRSTGDYQSVQPGESVAQGDVLWLYARTNQVIALRGDYTDPSTSMVAAGGAFVPNPGLEACPLQIPTDVSIWKFDAVERAWQAGLPGELSPFGHVPREIAPGDAVYIHSPVPVGFSVPPSESRVDYYHPDHLDSSSVVTDGAGKAVEETAYHPFGGVRHQSRPGNIDSSYGFTQKERDSESRLHYFDARYVASPLARFLSFDPMVQHLETLDQGTLTNLLAQPAKLNPFAYALNNPVRYNDPDGRDPRPRTVPAKREHPKPAQSKSDVKTRMRPASKDIAPKRATQKGKAAPSGAGKVHFSDILITHFQDSVSTDMFMAIDSKSVIDSVDPVRRGKWDQSDEASDGMKNALIRGMSAFREPDSGKQTVPANAGARPFDDSEPPSSTSKTTPRSEPDPRTKK